MTQPFKCPQCGSNDYVVVLSGCTIKGATVHESYMWNDEANDYNFGGSMVVESESVEHEAAHALCAACEADVTEAVGAWEGAQPGPGDGQAQA